MTNDEITQLTDKQLRRREQNASRLVAELAAADDPGIGLARDEAQRVRDERI